MKKRMSPYTIFSLIVLLAFLVISFLVIFHFMKNFGADPKLFKAYLDSFGKGRRVAIFFLLQIAQIVFPIVPGEILEVGAGYVFGPFWGLFLCELGVLFASFPIFLLVRRFGQRFVLLIFESEKIKSLSFLHNEKKLSAIVFLLFFLPGTPKDLLTYVVGLTPIPVFHFLLISLFARIPSILTSTLAGANIGTDNMFIALIIFAATGVVSLIGLFIYSKYIKKQGAKILVSAS